MKYIGADVHISSITFTVLAQNGTVLDQTTLALSENLITDYIENITGQKELTFEEGPLAEWMINILNDKVDKLLVCDPKKNALIYSGRSNDKVDSKNLADLLRVNSLKEVKHPLIKSRQEFRELMHLWFKIQKEITRAKLRLKSKFRMNGIQCNGETVYNEKNRQEWLDKLPKNSISKTCVMTYWEQINFLKLQEENIYVEIKNRIKMFPEMKEFMKERGVGLITAATFSAFIFTPFRFQTKAKLWAYCGLSLVENDTGIKINKAQEIKRQKKVLKKLTRDGNRKIKSLLKSATQCACHRCKDGPLFQKYKGLIERGLSSNSAILATTRLLTTKLWGIWKRIERERNKKQ